MRAESRSHWTGLGLGLIPVLMLVLLSLSALASAGDSYHLDRASVDHAGGGFALNNNYELVVAIGQHDAGEILESDHYRFAGGVFARVPTDVLFKNGFEGD